MGARNGVTVVIMVQNGFTGVRDALSGEHNALEAVGTATGRPLTDAHSADFQTDPPGQPHTLKSAARESNMVPENMFRIL
jgi:hypothetical protein